MKPPEREAKYWICEACALKNKWIFPDYAFTAIDGLCGHCDRKDKVMLTPVIDFRKPGQRFLYWD